MTLARATIEPEADQEYTDKNRECRHPLDHGVLRLQSGSGL